ncbi:hypothetical protein LOAG_03658 [Loa loa]|nr:hypothetical protein LOAG_03658 [Loa loa]EFO24829.1 hypothetical protein LOAG_03658 [Loa loa]
MAGRLSVLRKMIPSVSKDLVKSDNARKSNIPLSLNDSCICGRNTVLPIGEMVEIANQKNERNENI